MPEKRKYVEHQYSESDLDKALERCKNGESYRKVSATFNIPKSTLCAKFKGTLPVHAKKGPKTNLLEEEEARLTKWILGKARLGFPMHVDEVKCAVNKVLDEAARESTFKDNMPGDKWINLFLKRHPEIKIKQTELISKGRASVTEEKLRQWFSDVGSYLNESGLQSVLERPECIFNGDETGVQLCPNSGRLLGPRKEKNFYEISSGKEKETVTVLCSFSAAGKALPPMVMLPYKRMPSYLTKSVPADWSIGKSDSGWMVSSTFYEYMANVFHPWCVKEKLQFPVIYFLDGHKSHLSLELSDFCLKNQIILVALFPNATHIIQPCDVAVFRALKYRWKKVVLEHKQETQVSITKSTFAPLFQKAFNQLSIDTIKNGFRKCGLYPFCADAVDYDRCISTRRQEMKYTADKKLSELLQYNDFTSTKKFFDCFIEKEKMEQYIEIRKTNQDCNDAVYLLWKTCMEKLESSKEHKHEKNNKSVYKSLSQHSMQDNVSTSAIDKSIVVSVDTSEDIFSNRTDESQDLFIAQDSIQVIFVDDDSILDILDIPVIDLSNLETTAITDPNLKNTDNKLCDTIAIERNSSYINVRSEIEMNAVESIERSIERYAESNSINANNEEALMNCKNSPSRTDHAKELNCLESNNNLNNGDLNIPIKKLIEPTNKTGVHSQINPTSSIWDKHLVWPSSGVTKSKIKQTTEKLPCVLTSAQWREYQLKKKEEKEKKELKKEQRILQRKIKKEETESKKQKLREERELKKAEKQKIEKKNADKKQHLKQQKLAQKVVNLKRKKPQKLSINQKKRCPLQTVNLNIQNTDVPIDLTKSN